MEPKVQNVQPVNKPVAQPKAQFAAVPFTESEIKYGLWRAVACTKNGAQANDAGEALLRMFVLNGDADKALEAATAIQAVKADILDASRFELEAAKPVTKGGGKIALRVSFKVTGAEIKARAAAIITLASTAKQPTILEQSARNAQPRKSGNLAAGLLK